MIADSYGNTWRTCARCSAWILTVDQVTPDVHCPKCQREEIPFAQWSADLKEGDLVYLQPGCPLRPEFVRSRHVVTDRDGDMLTVHPLGVPGAQVRVHVGNTASRDVAPWRNIAMY